MEEIKKNIVMLGDGAVGKTSLIRKFVDDRFSDNYIATVGSKVSKKEMILKTDEGEKNLVLLVWDLIGQHGYRQSQALSMRKADGAILVCDLTRRETLDNLHDYWIPQFINVRGISPLIFLGNKFDMKEDNQYGLNEIIETSKKSEKYGAEDNCFLTSAKTGANVEEAFLSVASSIALRDFNIRAYRPVDMGIKSTSRSVDILDQIIVDFSEQFGGIETATPIIKKQMEKSNLDINDPKYLSIIQFVDNLAEVESKFKKPDEVAQNKMKRLALFGYSK